MGQIAGAERPWRIAQARRSRYAHVMSNSILAPTPSPLAQPAAAFNARLTGLTCFACGQRHDHRSPQTVCRSCGMPLRVDYAIDRTTMPRAALRDRAALLWRYREVLPLASGEVTLVEGWTPLLPVDTSVWIKDEARNPTGSFKARGMTAAVSVASALNARAFAAPSAGNAAGALAAYGAAAHCPVVVAMPDDTPSAFVAECRLYGADVHSVQGTISDAGKRLRTNGPSDAWMSRRSASRIALKARRRWHTSCSSNSTVNCPMSLCIRRAAARALSGCGRPSAKCGRWGGWAKRRLPRMVSVQAAGCAPVVRGFESGAERTEPWTDAETEPMACEYPRHSVGFSVCGRCARHRVRRSRSRRTALRRRPQSSRRCRGSTSCPEGGAAWSAVATLRERGWIQPSDRVVVFNTGTGLKYRT